MSNMRLDIAILKPLRRELFRYFLLIFALNMLVFNVSASESYTESAAYHSKQFYIGGGMGAGINFFSPTNSTITVDNPAHASFAWRLFSGYNLNKNLAFEVGYTNLGFYENSAIGHSICNTQGACGYPEADPFNGIFNTQINVVNQIQAYSLDLSMIGRYNLTSRFNIFGKLGVSYLNASLNTNTTISPQIGSSSNPIGPTINQTLTANNQNTITPLVGIGYEYNPNQLLGIRFEYDYYVGGEMIDQNGINQGKLYPSTILLSTVFNL